MTARVIDYATGDMLVGRPSRDLREASESEGTGTGAVSAYRREDGVWQLVESDQVDFYERQRGERVVTVWVCS